MRSGWSNPLLDRAIQQKALKLIKGKYVRPTLLPDMLLQMVSFEAKVGNPVRAAIQAARRRVLVDRTYLAMPSPRLAKWSTGLVQVLDTSGVGVIDSVTGQILRPSPPKRPRRWARYVVARALARGLQR